jgi:hypothetical protein
MFMKENKKFFEDDTLGGVIPDKFYIKTRNVPR